MLDLSRVQIVADLACELNGNVVRIRSHPDRKIVCELPNAKTLFEVRRLCGKTFLLRNVGRWLSLTDQTVEVFVADKLIARFGSDASDRLLSLMGVTSTELKLWEIAKLAIKR